MKKILFDSLLLTLLLNLVSFSSSAEGLLHWQDTSLSYLYGTDFKVDPQKQHTVTIEYANGWQYGDTFFFVDFSRSANDEKFVGPDSGPTKNSHYLEFSPRFSAGKIFNTDLSLSFISDLLLATNVESGIHADSSINVGPGIDMKVPGFNFLQLNLYYRFSDSGDSDGWQLTPVWNTSFAIGDSEIVFDGFIDWVFSAENKGEGYEPNLHFNPQLKYNLGRAIWGESQNLYVGIEYDYWKNKYGIQDSSFFSTDQSVTSLLVQYHW